MSHYLVAVFTKRMSEEEIDNLMAPYEEDDTGGKWDYYQIGGTWDGALTDKAGNTCNSIRVRDFYDESVTPYAYVTADGTWVAKGEMGWFGLGDETEESTRAFEKNFAGYLERARKDGLYMTVLDCHI